MRTRNLIFPSAASVAALAAAHDPAVMVLDRNRRFVGRMRACDVAFTFRMGAGVPGDVNRHHPASIEPVLFDPTNPPTLTGQPVVAVTSSQGVRKVLTSDSGLTAIYGITVRPYPYQSSGSGVNYGGDPLGTGSLAGISQGDVLRSGYIMVAVSGALTNVKKGAAAFIWYAAASGAHVTGGFEADSSGSTFALDAKTTWNGSPDSNGVAELAFNI